MAKYYIGCEGSQEEFYDFVLDLASKIEYAKFPWEHPSVQRAMREGELAKPEEAPAAQVKDPAPAEKKEYISLEALQKKCCDLGDTYGQPVFQQLKKQAGFVSMKKLEPADRQKFADLIDQYIADNPKG